MITVTERENPVDMVEFVEAAQLWAEVTSKSKAFFASIE